MEQENLTSQNQSKQTDAEIKVKVKPARVKKDKNKTNAKRSIWVLTVLVLTLVLASVFSVVSELLFANSGLLVAYIIMVVIIVISIIFDIIGTATAKLQLEPLLSMASKKVKGAKIAVKLCKNAEKVSSVCCDIIGDICGILSGAGSSTIVLLQAALSGKTDTFILSIIMASIIAAVTVTGKAIGKVFAMNAPNQIIMFVSKILSIFSKN